MRARNSCNLQPFIKTHFTHHWLANPVDEGLWFLCGVGAAAAHLQLHHLTLSILRRLARCEVMMWTRWYTRYCSTNRMGVKEPTEGSKEVTCFVSFVCNNFQLLVYYTISQY